MEHAADRVAADTSLDRKILQLLGEVLYSDIDNIDPDAQFLELGLDSVLAVEFMALLKARLGVTVEAETVYSYCTPRSFARFVDDLKRKR